MSPTEAPIEKIALVTGGSRGIGRAIVLALGAGRLDGGLQLPRQRRRRPGG